MKHMKDILNKNLVNNCLLDKVSLSKSWLVVFISKENCWEYLDVHVQLSSLDI